MTQPSARVLVVDDEPNLRELLVDALAGPDLEVTTAASGAEAIQLARQTQPDLLVADLYLGDCTGVDVIDQLRESDDDLPAVVITGSDDAEQLTHASRRRPVELMTKPLDLERLRRTVHTELTRKTRQRLERARARRLRSLIRSASRQRRTFQSDIDTRCRHLAGAYRNLAGQLANQRIILNYQRDLLAAKTDDDVFRALFRLFVRRSGPIFGVAMACDSNAQLNVVGRFGVPYPDPIEFCNVLTEPLIDAVLTTPQVMLIDAQAEKDLFGPTIHRHLPGMSVLVIPLIPAPGELIGLVTLYRKGEQPFIESDIVTAEMIATPTAIAVRRND